MTTGKTVEAALLAACLAAFVALATRALDVAPNYDEGVYLASDDALRAGGSLGTDVFASQPPGFYVVLRIATALPGDSVSATRTLFLVLALAGIVAAWALGRALVSPAGGIAAAAILSIAPAYSVHAARISADVPAMAFALAGLAALAYARPRSSTWLAVLGGVALGLAVAVKLLAVVALVPAAVLLFDRRRLALAAVAGGLATAAVFLLLHARALGGLYEDVVGFHRDARADGDSLRSNVDTVLRAFHPRLAWPWLVGAGALAAVLQPQLLRRTASLWLFTIASFAFLAWHRPLLDHHFALLAAAASTAAGATLGGTFDSLRRGRTFAIAAVGLLLAGAYVQQWRALTRLPGPDPEVEQIARLVSERTSPGEVIITDLPIVAHLAGRRLPGELVDTSAVRLASGSLEPERVLRLADAEAARVVVVGRMFQTLPALLGTLEQRFPNERRVGAISLLERGRAAARAAQDAERE